MFLLVAVLLLAGSIHANALAESWPKVQSTTSPDGKIEAHLAGHIYSGGRDPWSLAVGSKSFVLGASAAARDAAEAKKLLHAQAYGIRDFVFSPDSQAIAFVFAPVESAGSKEDCIGILDIKTMQYNWIAGRVMSGKEFKGPTGRFVSFSLSWKGNGVVSYQEPQEERHDVRVDTVRKQWRQNEQNFVKAKATAQKFAKALATHNLTQANTLVLPSAKGQVSPVIKQHMKSCKGNLEIEVSQFVPDHDAMVRRAMAGEKQPSAKPMAYFYGHFQSGAEVSLEIRLGSNNTVENLVINDPL